MVETHQSKTLCRKALFLSLVLVVYGFVGCLAEARAFPLNPLKWGAPSQASDTTDSPASDVSDQPHADVKKPSKQAQKAASEKKPPEATPARQAKVLYNQGVDAFQLAQFQGARGNHAGQLSLFKSAAKQFKAALKLDPTLVEAQTNLGYLNMAENQPKKAIPAFQAALLINPNHLSALNGLANAYVLLKQLPEAEATFQKLVNLAPGESDYWFNLGSVLQKEAKPEEAQAAYQNALKAQPDHQRALFNLATLSHNQGHLTEARGYYERAKTAGIETPVGLEALRRLRAMDTAAQIVPEPVE